MSTEDLATNTSARTLENLGDPGGGALAAERPHEERPAGRVQPERIDRSGRLTLDRRGHAAYLDGSSIKLTAREFRLLLFLYEHRGRALSRDQVLESVWGSAYNGGRRTVDVHVRRLRAKFREHLPLETLRGVGYKLRDELSVDAQRRE